MTQPQTDNPNVSVIIPTRNGGIVCQETLQSVLTLHPHTPTEVILIDSESADGTADAAESLFADPSANPHGIRLRVVRIPVQEFGHGRTRNTGAEMAHGEILVFLSQDATPIGSDWLSGILRAFSQSKVAGMYCRQIPRPGTSLPERYNLESAFPSHGATITQASLGRVSVLFSNAASAMRRDIWRQYPFDEHLMMCEDQYWALKVLQAGYNIAYSAEACVAHSHSYDWKTLISRYFDSGVALPKELAGAGRRSYLKYLAGELAFIGRHGGLGSVPWMLAYESGRYLGFTLGAHQKQLPRRLSKRLSAYPRWFDTSSKVKIPTRETQRVCFLVCNSSEAGARVRREAEAIAMHHPTIVLAVPGALSTLVVDVQGTQQMLGHAVERISRITARTFGNYRALLIPRPGRRDVKARVTSDSRHVSEVEVRLPAAGTIWSLLAINFRLALMATYQRATLYHAHDMDTLPAALIAAKINRAKVIYDSHELWPDMSPTPARRLFWRVLEGLLIHRADRVVTINQSIANELTRRYGVPCDVIHNFPSASGADDQHDLGDWRDQMGISERNVVVRYHGLFLAGRGIEELLRSVPLLDERVIVTLQGYGPVEDDLRALAEELQVHERVIFLGPVPGSELVRAARRADIGIAPIRATHASHQLSSPNKVYEYMQAGLAIVVSDLPEMRAIVERTGAGVVCNPEEPESIAQAINLLATDHERLCQAKEAAKRAASQYRWENEAPRLFDLYQLTMTHAD